MHYWLKRVTLNYPCKVVAKIAMNLIVANLYENIATIKSIANSLVFVSVIIINDENILTVKSVEKIATNLTIANRLLFPMKSMYHQY